MSFASSIKVKTKKASSGSKTPQFYNEERMKVIKEAAKSSEAAVRKFIASNTHTPQKVLKDILSTEKSKDVLREVLMNDSLPKKAILEFVNSKNDPRHEMFDADEKLIAYINSLDI